MLKRLLFPVKPDGTATSAMLLIARIVFGILLAVIYHPTLSRVGITYVYN